VPAGAEILDLGAGAGRIARTLVELGHPVVAVDQSAEMLAHVAGAETVVADIETLALGRRFPVVLLASNLVNAADGEERLAFLACCARHVAPAGQVLIQRFPPGWEPRTGWRESGDLRLRLARVERDGGLVSGAMEYALGGRRFAHAFRARLLSDGELDAELRAAGLERGRVLDERGEWIEARPEK